MLKNSKLLENIQALESLSGEFYFYEPREYCINSGSGSPLVWKSDNPNRAESISMGDLDRYSLQLCASLGSSLAKLSPVEAVERICERKLWGSVALLWLSDHALSGDYHGAPYTASNCRVLLKEHGREGNPEIRETYGSYGSQSVVIDPRYLSEDLLESLESLENYPVLDEDDCAALELELQSEAWASWASRDFSRYLENRLSDLLDNEEEAESKVEALSDSALFGLFETLRDRADLYWESQSSPDQWIDVEAVLDSADDSEILEILETVDSDV
jgi:hypothetical protein